MRKCLKNLALGILIIITWNYVTHQYIDVCGNSIDFESMIRDIIFSPQKILFNNMLGIMLCIYVNTFDMNRIEYVIRNRKKILIDQISIGIKICFVYSFVSIMTVFISALSIIEFQWHSIFLFVTFLVKLFLISYVFFLLFMWFSMISKRVLAFCLVVSIDLIILVGWNIYSFYFPQFTNFALTDNVWIHISMITIMLISAHCYLKKKEYI